METIILALIGLNWLAAFALSIAVYRDALAAFRERNTR